MATSYTIRCGNALRRYWEVDDMVITAVHLYQTHGTFRVEIAAPLEALLTGIGIDQKRDVRALTLNAKPVIAPGFAKPGGPQNVFGGHFLRRVRPTGVPLRFAHLYLDLEIGDLTLDSETLAYDTKTQERWDEIRLTGLFDEADTPSTIRVFRPGSREPMEPGNADRHGERA